MTNILDELLKEFGNTGGEARAEPIPGPIYPIYSPPPYPIIAPPPPWEK